MNEQRIQAEASSAQTGVIMRTALPGLGVYARLSTTLVVTLTLAIAST